jgi:hypothetical protein
VKVIAWFKPDKEHDESFFTVEIPETDTPCSPMQAISYAKDILRDRGEDLSNVDHYEVEEDFL